MINKVNYIFRKVKIIMFFLKFLFETKLKIKNYKNKKS